MKISKNIETEFNNQINEEWYSAYLYQSMAAWFEGQNLKGFANWMKTQAAEEIAHGFKFYTHLFERAGQPVLKAIAKPKAEWKSPLDAFQDAYKHELHITERIHMLVDLASKEKDKAAESMLQWFVDEQVEEEDQTLEIVELLKKVKDSFNGLMMIDHKLGARKGD